MHYTETFGQTKGVSLAQSVYVMHIKIHFKQALGQGCSSHTALSNLIPFFLDTIIAFLSVQIVSSFTETPDLIPSHNFFPI